MTFLNKSLYSILDYIDFVIEISPLENFITNDLKNICFIVFDSNKLSPAYDILKIIASYLRNCQ